MNGKEAVNQKQDLSTSQDWQSSKFTSVERSKYLLETGLHADCEFLVGDGVSTVEELIKAHQIFLAMSSPVFETMFYGKLAEAANSNKNVPIAIPDLTPSSFRDLLQYIYTDSLILVSMDQAICLCYAAKKYILPDLVAKCVQYMLDNLSTVNVCRVLEFSKLIGEEHLQTKCLSLLQEKTRESLSHSGFKDVSESTLMSIVKDEALNINELELFDAVVCWAGHQCAPKGCGVEKTTMRDMLGDLISEIRFLSMTSKEFASTPALSGILTEKECMAIFLNLNNPGSLPLPLQLSSCRMQRREASNTFSSPSAINNGERSTTNHRIYCVRKVEKRCFAFFRNAMRIAKFQHCFFGVTSFAVDQEVQIKSIIIAELVLNEQPALLNGHDMVIECHFLDSSNCKLASAISRVSPPWSEHPITIEPVFNHPVSVKRNRTYLFQVFISNHRPQFLLGMTSPDVVFSQGVQFQFSTNCSNNDLVRGVTFNK